MRSATLTAMPRLEVKEVPTSDLIQHPENARTHDVGSIMDSLATHGQFQPIVVQDSTGYIIAGNGRHKAATKLGWDTVQAVYLDVDDDMARKLLLVDNRTSDLSGYDNEALLALLENMDDLAGTGYDYEDVDDLVALLEEMDDGDEIMAGPEALGGIAGRQEGYLSRSLRSIVLDYEGDEYIWVVDRIHDLRDRFNVDNNADAVFAALRELFPNEEVPLATEGD